MVRYIMMMHHSYDKQCRCENCCAQERDIAAAIRDDAERKKRGDIVSVKFQLRTWYN